MAKTKRNCMLIDEARSKIQTTQLINRLQNHALGKIEMSITQIQATKILLGKKIPDVQAVTLSNDPDNPLPSAIDETSLAQRIAFLLMKQAKG